MISVSCCNGGCGEGGFKIVLGAGKNEIDKSVFLNQQKEFLLSGSNGMIKIGNEIVEYKLPTGKNGFQTPKNDAQKEEFKKSEDQRRASCEKYFK